MPRLFLLLVVVLSLVATIRAAEPADPRKPPAITTTGVPTVPAELFAALRQFRNIRQAGFAGWSPDGKGLLIRTTFGNTSQLHRVYEPGGRREQVTFFDEPVRGGFLPETKDGALLLSSSSGGSENDQIYFLDGSTFRMTLLTDGKSKNGLGPARHDGGRIVISSNRRNGTDTDLYLADPRKADSMQMLMEVKGEFWAATDWSRDGKQLLLRRYVSANESYPAVFDITAMRRKDLPLPGKAPLAIGPMRFTPDGKQVYLASDARGEFQELARLDLASGEYTWLTGDIPWDVEEIEIAETGLVAFTTNEDGATQLYLFDGEKRRKLEVPLGVISSLEFSPDGKRLGFTLVRGDAPADVFSIPVTGEAKLTRWTYSEIGGLDPATLVAPKRIRYKSFDGREIPAYYYPAVVTSQQSKEIRSPVFISIHGGPEGQYQPGLSGGTQYLAGQMGVAVIHPNVRGSNGYGKTYLKLDNGMLREDSVKDIGALLDWIAQQPELDASRVAVGGGSYGGYMVLASLTNFPDRIKAGVDIVGIANFITFLESTAPYRRDLRRPEYGDERDEKMRAFLTKISPTTNVDKIRSALMVAHGKNDPRVPFAEAEQIAAKVHAAGRPVWTVYADNEGHGFARRDNGEYLQAVQMLFLREQLGIK